MSFYKSLDDLKYKLCQKNIVVVGGNVDDFISLKQLKSKAINAYVNENYAELPDYYQINLFQYLALFFKTQDFKSINAFGAGIGQLDLNNPIDLEIKANSDADEAQQNDDTNPFANFNENQASSLTEFVNKIIQTVNEDKKDLLNNSEIHHKIVYIVNLSNILFKDLDANLIASLINSFILNFYHNKGLYWNNQFKLILVCNNDNALNDLIINKNVEVAKAIVNKPDFEERKNVLEQNLNIINKYLKEPLKVNSFEFDEAVSLCNDLSFREIYQLINIARSLQKEEKFNKFSDLFHSAFFNKKESEWERIDNDKLKQFENVVKKRVKGQDEAIQIVKRTLIRSAVGLSDSTGDLQNKKKPKGVLFFTGPTGVGKTELSKSLAQFVFGDESALIRFDMSEYNHEQSDEKLIGAPPGYVGHDNGGQLTNKVKEKPFCILLFDEIEKANGKILDKFLQILEDGRLTSGQGETIDFSETFIIFTSNLGVKEVNERINSDNINSKEQISELFKQAVEKYFVQELKRPEILNRIGKKNIVPFNFINDKKIINEIIENKINNLRSALLKTKSISLINKTENDLKNVLLLISKKIDYKYGARDVVNKFEESFIDTLTDFLFVNNKKIMNNKRSEKPEILNVCYFFDEETQNLEFAFSE